MRRRQAAGPSNGVALRSFSRGAAYPDLGLRPIDGHLIGEQGRHSGWRTIALSLFTDAP
jgi:hypothetical protein